MKRVIAVCLAAAMLVLLAASCQPTPEEPVVVQKDMQQMIEKGMASSTPTQTDAPSQAETPSPTTYAELCSSYGVPEHFKTSITEGNLTVNCDVAIELPETVTLPMARVEAGRYSQEQVYTLFKALCKDTPMYLPSKQMNKEYYEKRILRMQQRIAEVTDKDYIDSLSDSLAEIEKQYKNAPEYVELVPADGTLETNELNDDTNTISGRFTSVEASSDPFDDTAMSFSMRNYPEYKKDGVYTFLDEEGNRQEIAPDSLSRLWFEREGINSRFGGSLGGRTLADVTKLSLTGGAVDNFTLSTTPQQARKTVENFLEQTGIDDMVIDTVSLYSSRDEPPPEVIEHMKEQGRPYREDIRPETHAYLFRLLRRVNDVNVESATGWESQSSVEGMDIGKEWDYESLSISVDDKGIVNLYWEAPLNVGEIMTKETAIRPWSEIEDIFEKMMVIKHEYDANSKTYTTVFDITRVSLTLRRIMERDSYTTGLLVPVWNFFGTSTSQKDGGEPVVRDQGDYPLMTINAIDGSIIDIGKGY